MGLSRSVPRTRSLGVIMSPDDGAENTLQHAVGVQSGAGPPGPRHRVDHIPDAAVAAQLIVHILQHQRGLGIVADLEELDADLPGGGVEAIEFRRGRQDDGLHVVGGLAVGDDDDVERFDGVFAFSFQFAQIRAEDVVQARARRGAAPGAHAVEDGFHRGRGGDVAVFDVVPFVQEVDVDAVGVPFGADRRDPFQRFGRFAPRAAGHGPGVIDQEDGVKGGEVGEVGVFSGPRAAGGIGNRSCGVGGRRCGAVGWWGF